MVDFKLTADGKIDVNSVNIELAAKDDPETCKKVEDFCAYLDAYQSSLSIPDTVVDDLNTLAAEIGKAAMGYGYIEGTKDAGKAFVSMMQARTQMDKIDQPAPSVAPCSVDILGISLGEEGLLIIPREVRMQCEPLVNAANALMNALNDLPVSTVDKNTIALLAADLMAQAEQEGVKNGVEAYTDFTHDMTPEKLAELEKSVKGDSMPS